MTGREIRVSKDAALTRWNFVSEAVTETFFSCNKIIASSWPQQRSRKAEQSQCLTWMVLDTFDLHQQLATVSTLFVRHEMRQSSQQARHGPNSTDCLIKDSYQAGITSGKSKTKWAKIWHWIRVSLFEFGDGINSYAIFLFLQPWELFPSLLWALFFNKIFIVCPQTNCKQDLWKEYSILCTSCPRWK